MLDIVNPEDEAGHLPGHDHDHDHEDEDEDEDGDEEMDDEEEETDEAYEIRLAEAKTKFKKDREDAYTKYQSGVFKFLLRSKGFIWLSNRPNLFFEWS